MKQPTEFGKSRSKPGSRSFRDRMENARYVIRVRTRGYKKKKWTSPYASNWGWYDDYVPPAVTLAPIDPTKAAAAFRAAMDKQELI